MRTGHYQIFGSLHVHGIIGSKQVVTNCCLQSRVSLVVSLHRGRSGIISRVLTERLAGYFGELPVHLVMLFVRLTLCQKLALPSGWRQFSGSPTDVRERSGVQRPKGIVMRQFIQVRVSERSRMAKLLLLG